jgi:hypothetical protein
MVAAPVFELTPGEGDLGLWGRRDPHRGDVSDPVPGAAWWHVDLSAALDLRGLRQQADDATSNLPRVADRLDHTVGDAGAAAAYGPPAGEATVAGSAEGELLAWLDRGAVAEGRLAFGGPAHAGWLVGAQQDLAELLDRLRSWAAPTATVRTSAGDHAVAATAHRWSGQTATAVVAGASAVELALHMNAVELVAASRRAVLRALGLAVDGVARIGSRLLLPGGPLIALPATWRFVNRVLHEMEGTTL